MPDDLDQKQTEFIVKEAVHRADVIAYAKDSLASIPDDDEEAHIEQRERLFEQARHYKKMLDGILEAINEDLIKFE